MFPKLWRGNLYAEVRRIVFHGSCLDRQGKRLNCFGWLAWNYDFDLAIMHSIKAGNPQLHRAGVDVRQESEGFDVGFMAGLDEDGLPDAAGGGVPAPLFADGLFGIIHRVFDTEHQQPM